MQEKKGGLIYSCTLSFTSEIEDMEGKVKVNFTL